MTGPARVLLHIGTHKTGSTSLQKFLDRQRDRLATAGVDMFRGCHIASNHVELHAAAMRSDRLTPFKLDRRLVVDDGYRAQVAGAVADFLATGAGTPLFSAEGLSYLRHPDELARLRALFPGRTVEIVVYLRDPDGYRQSHAAEFVRRAARGGAIDPAFADLEDGSWLLDYRARLQPFRAAFGSEHVHVLDYDVEVARDGSVIPSLLRLAGVDHAFAPADWADFAYNVAAR